jgi:20S proteasome alpha/beta subunit
MYTLYSSVRPFGSSVIMGTVDKEGPQLYMIEPSGVYWVRLTKKFNVWKFIQNLIFLLLI